MNKLGWHCWQVIWKRNLFRRQIGWRSFDRIIFKRTLPNFCFIWTVRLEHHWTEPEYRIGT